MKRLDRLLESAGEDQMFEVHVDGNSVGKARQAEGEWERGDMRCQR